MLVLAPSADDLTFFRPSATSFSARTAFCTVAKKPLSVPSMTISIPSLIGTSTLGQHAIHQVTASTLTVPAETGSARAFGRRALLFFYPRVDRRQVHQR